MDNVLFVNMSWIVVSLSKMKLLIKKAIDLPPRRKLSAGTASGVNQQKHLLKLSLLPRLLHSALFFTLS